MKRFVRNSLIVVAIAAILGLAADTLLISWPGLWSRLALVATLLILSACLAADTILALWGLKQTSWREARVLLICLLTPVTFLVPYFVFGISSGAHLHFFALKGRYEKAVPQFLSLAINPDGEFIELSEKFPQMGLGHTVYVAKRGSATDIMFVVTGFGPECTGYIFSSDGAPPFEGMAGRICDGKGGAWYYGHNWPPAEGAD